MRSTISLLSKLEVLGSDKQAAMRLLASKGFSNITDTQSGFLEDMLDLLLQHPVRKQHDLVMEAIKKLAETTSPQFHYIPRGTRKLINITSTVDISTPANVKVRWNKEGREITSTTTMADVNNGSVDIPDFPYYHGGFYKLDVIYEDGGGNHPIDEVFVVTKDSKGEDSLLLPAPTFVSATPAGDNEDTALVWTNPTHKDFKFAVWQTADGLTLYRGNGTTFTYYHDKAGAEVLYLYSEGPDGHISDKVEVKLTGMVLSSDLTAGGTNLITLAESLAANPMTVRELRYIEKEPILDVYLFGEGEVLVEGNTVPPALTWDGCKFPITISNFANSVEYCYDFRLEVFDCESGTDPVFIFENFLKLERILMLFVPASQLTLITPGKTTYTYKIFVTTAGELTQLIREGDFYCVPCGCQIPETEAPNDHYWLTNPVASTSEVEESTLQCGCSSTCNCS